MSKLYFFVTESTVRLCGKFICICFYFHYFCMYYYYLCLFLLLLFLYLLLLFMIVFNFIILLLFVLVVTFIILVFIMICVWFYFHYSGFNMIYVCFYFHYFWIYSHHKRFRVRRSGFLFFSFVDRLFFLFCLPVGHSAVELPVGRFSNCICCSKLPT